MKRERATQRERHTPIQRHSCLTDGRHTTNKHSEASVCNVPFRFHGCELSRLQFALQESNACLACFKLLEIFACLGIQLQEGKKNK